MYRPLRVRHAASIPRAQCNVSTAARRANIPPFKPSGLVWVFLSFYSMGCTHGYWHSSPAGLYVVFYPLIPRASHHPGLLIFKPSGLVFFKKQLLLFSQKEKIHIFVALIFSSVLASPFSFIIVKFNTVLWFLPTSLLTCRYGIFGQADFCSLLSRLHAVQSSFNSCWYPFTSGAKYLQQLLIPFCVRRKALSTVVETILHEVQSPLNSCWYPFTWGAKPLQQLLIPLCACCNVL